MPGKAKVVFGDVLNSNPFVSINDTVKVSIPGMFQGKNCKLNLNDELLSKHLLLIGGTGCGKTNVMFLIIKHLKKSMTPNDVMIIFDTKGDFYKEFYVPADKVISNSKQYADKSEKWNIFREIAADGWENDAIIMNANEITYSLFYDAISKNNSNPFFPQAARDLFASILIQEMRNGSIPNPNIKIQPELYKKKFLNNAVLQASLNSLSVPMLKNWITSPDLQSIFTYTGDGDNTQGLGVLAELQYVIRQVLIGEFAQQGFFSMRNFVKKKGAKTLFIEYDLSLGSMLAPIYRILFDLALKEAMGRTKTEGNIYLICDEFKLLPNLQHIEDAVNFGRSLGVKVIAGLQSIKQLQEIYGDDKATNIIAGFSSLFAFRMNDTSSREYISKLYGENYTIDEHLSLGNKIIEKERSGKTVEDWDLNLLRTGDAVIGLNDNRPFQFKFDLYK